MQEKTRAEKITCNVVYTLASIGIGILLFMVSGIWDAMMRWMAG
jgi:hypothetical protein